MTRSIAVLAPLVAMSSLALFADSSAAHPGDGATVAARPRVHVVRMLKEGERQHFVPATVVAAPGDTLRFVNGQGRHNVDFPADSNPAGVALPAPTAVADHPGETFDVPVTLPPGHYYFQCDPHATMHMVAHLVVRAR